MGRPADDEAPQEQLADADRERDLDGVCRPQPAGADRPRARSPGGSATTSIDDSSIAIRGASSTEIRPRTRALTTSDQTWVSQNTMTVTTTDRAIPSVEASERHWTATRPVTSSDP